MSKAGVFTLIGASTDRSFVQCVKMMRKEWYDQLPVIVALCYSSQDEPDANEALREALEILDECATVDMAVVRARVVKER